MATKPLQPGTAPANADACSTSRRKVLGLFAVAPLAGLPSAAYGASSFAGLSPRVRVAVAAWAASGHAYGTFTGDDEPANILLEREHSDICAVAAIPSETLEDVAVKTYMLALVECGLTGPQPLVQKVAPHEEGYEETHLWRGVMRDLPLTSPAVRALVAYRGA